MSFCCSRYPCETRRQTHPPLDQHRCRDQCIPWWPARDLCRQPFRPTKSLLKQHSIWSLSSKEYECRNGTRWIALAHRPPVSEESPVHTTWKCLLQQGWINKVGWYICILPFTKSNTPVPTTSILLRSTRSMAVWYVSVEKRRSDKCDYWISSWCQSRSMIVSLPYSID